MSVIKSFRKDNRGSTVDTIALFCAVVAVLSVLGAHALDMLERNGDLPTIAFTRAGGHSGIDYSATGSIPDRAERTELKPCGRNGDER
ncbi:hypothetical protein [Rhodoblastus sp.]|uniref:hypothetical protein n=1 Tax=Rhodoblastus sp. TaxID=1962975 RepID=UPI0026040D21|nr:hypothetical protein [Rhodoblastus sp.]